jgi:hypothetical protein
MLESKIAGRNYVAKRRVRFGVRSCCVVAVSEFLSPDWLLEQFGKNGMSDCKT